MNGNIGDFEAAVAIRDQAEEEAKRAWTAVKREATRVQEALSDVVERHTTGRGEPN